ncbi:MAG: DUF1501 domain-containing protein [Pirellulaceae bacterium]
MLTIETNPHQKTCAGYSRRELLKIGSLGLGGLTLPTLLKAKAEPGGFVQDKAVVLLFLGGGPSHIETFNPNMGAPSPFRSMTGEVKTAIPGITLGGTFPRLARHVDKLAIVRSFHHNDSSHSTAVPYVLSGGDVFSGGIGTVYSRLRGTNHQVTGMPTTALLTAPDIGRFQNPKKRIVDGSQPHELGAVYAPFNPSGTGPVIDNMSLNVSHGRLDDRRHLLAQLDRFKKHADNHNAIDSLDRFRQQAFNVVLGSATEALDLSREDPRNVERYDTSMYRVGEKEVRSCTLGKQMLLARRVIEAGCGFVTVQNSGWDMHGGSGNNFMSLASGMEMLGRPLDKAVSAFLSDLDERGLRDKVLLVITGEFGRTPKVNKFAGRDHWANLSTLLLAGGGLKTGQIVGQSAPKNDVPHSDPVGVENLMATIMHLLLDIGRLRLARGIPRQLLTPLEEHRPISSVLP